MKTFAIRVLAILLVAESAFTAQNILTNSGFEYGLMCYGINIWTDTDKFGKGDYHASMSTDAHSGQYSLELSCDGSDCPKAAAISNKIPTAPNQKYVMSAWVKCPAVTADPRGATIYIPGMADGNVFQKMTCNGEWTLNRFEFQTPATGSDFFFYLFNYGKGWARFDDLTLTYGNKKTVPAPLLHEGTRNVTVQNNTVMVDGSPYLALGFFEVPYGDLEKVAASGANTVFGLGSANTAACFNTTQKNYLDQAYELKLNFVPESSSTIRLGLPDLFGAAVKRYAPHLANIAWMMEDEPDQAFIRFWYTKPADYLAGYKAAKAQTSLPLFSDFQRASWSTTNEVEPYAAGADLFMAEPYGPELQNVTHATNMFKSFEPARPIWLAQDNPDAKIIVPKAYLDVINGATGVVFFTWETFKGNAAQVAAATQTFTELMQLKNVIFSQSIDTLVSGPAGIGTMSRYNDGSAYILAANPSAAELPATFKIAGLAEGQQIEVMFENRTITATAGQFTDTFPAVSRHVYAIKVPLDALTSAK